MQLEDLAKLQGPSQPCSVSLVCPFAFEPSNCRPRLLAYTECTHLVVWYMQAYGDLGSVEDVRTYKQGRFMVIRLRHSSHARRLTITVPGWTPFRAGCVDGVLIEGVKRGTAM